MSDRMRRIHRIHFVGIGGSGMSGIAEVLRESRLRSAGQRPQAESGHRAAREARCARDDRPPRRKRRRSRRGGHLERGLAGKSRSRQRAGAAHPGGAARRNARRAHALPLRDRRRRHARQDHDDQPHLIDPRRGRRRPHVRDRRTPEERRHQRAPRRRQISRGRSRRERCVVPAPESDDRDRHQHRQRSPRHTRRRFRAAASRASSSSCTTCRSTGSRCCAWTTRTSAASSPRSNRPVVGYGFSEGADLRAENLRREGLRTHFDVVRRADGLRLPRHREPAGMHNVLNSLAAIAVALEIGIAHEAIQRALAELPGHRPAAHARRRRQARRGRAATR